MAREVYLLVYHEAGRKPVPAHWAIFIPEVGNPNKGKVIHAVGSPFGGYGREFKRNYDISMTKRDFEKILLATVDEQYVKDVSSSGGITTDFNAQDAIESAATKVDPPGVSPKPLDPFAGKNCQHWINDYVDKLVRDRVLPQSALGVIDGASKV